MKLRNLGEHKTEVQIGDIFVLFSYQTPVAANINGRFFRTETKHSVTTSKHINSWLNGAKAELKPQSYFDQLADGATRP